MGVTTEGRVADLAGGVGALAFSPDGRNLAGPRADASLMLYAVDTGLPILTFEGSPDAVLKLAWSPNKPGPWSPLSRNIACGSGTPATVT